VLGSRRAFAADAKPSAEPTSAEPLPASQRLLPPFTTLTELILAVGERYADRRAFGTKGSDGEFHFATFAEVAEQVGHFRAALKGLGVQKGDKVAIISRNSLEWVLTAYGGYGLGAVNVPMYEQQKEADWRYIIQDSGATILVVNTEAIYDKVKEH
jgi:long-chain acyl-CoA synthetase